MVREQLAELIQSSENLGSYEQRQNVRRLVARLTQHEPDRLGAFLKNHEPIQISPLALLNGLAESLSQTEKQVTGWIAACEIVYQNLTLLRSAKASALSARVGSFLVMSGQQAIEACTLPDRLKYQLTIHYGCMTTELLSHDEREGISLPTLLAYGAEGLSYIEYEAGTWAELYHELFWLLGEAISPTEASRPTSELKNLLIQMNSLVRERELVGLSQWFSVLSPALLQVYGPEYTPAVPDCPV